MLSLDTQISRNFATTTPFLSGRPRRAAYEAAVTAHLAKRSELVWGRSNAAWIVAAPKPVRMTPAALWSRDIDVLRGCVHRFGDACVAGYATAQETQ
jgi:hypothetical protein